MKIVLLILFLFIPLVHSARPQLRMEMAFLFGAGNISQKHDYTGTNLDGDPESGSREVDGTLSGPGFSFKVYQQYDYMFWGVSGNYNKMSLSSSERTITNEDFVPLDKVSTARSTSFGVFGGVNWWQFRFGLGFDFFNDYKLIEEDIKYTGIEGFKLSFHFIPNWERKGFTLGVELNSKSLNKKENSSLPQIYETDNTANQGGLWDVTEKDLRVYEYFLVLGYIF